jgi:hypothetical protein
MIEKDAKDVQKQATASAMLSLGVLAGTHVISPSSVASTHLLTAAQETLLGKLLQTVFSFCVGNELIVKKSFTKSTLLLDQVTSIATYLLGASIHLHQQCDLIRGERGDGGQSSGQSLSLTLPEQLWSKGQSAITMEPTDYSRLPKHSSYLRAVYSALVDIGLALLCLYVDMVFDVFFFRKFKCIRFLHHDADHST